ATPLQVAASYAGIANDGAVMRPHVLKEVLDTKGASASAFESQVAFSPDVTATNLAVMQRSLVDVTKEGTAKGAFASFGVTVAGKTGTAQVAKKDDYAWFVGYAPANEPRYAVVVAIEQGGHGGSVAGPAARDILAALLGEPIKHVRAVDVSR
ncbi:MAG: penicillin-binding protein 2, partial [Rhodocyclaceae bacterium]|nr:penicillin-binding protein 2 [Rhodocyclaceae bacterium]